MMYDNGTKMRADVAGSDSVDVPPLTKLAGRIHSAAQILVERMLEVNNAGHRAADRISGESGPEPATDRLAGPAAFPPMGLGGQIGDLESAVQQLENILAETATASERMINRITRLG